MRDRSRRRRRAMSLPRTLASLLVLATALALRPQSGAAFSFDDVAQKARDLSSKPFEAPERVPDWMTEITYDQWRSIRFHPQHALWAADKLPFQTQFFHPGLYYDRVVAVNVVDAKGVRPLEFSPGKFDYGGTGFASRVPQKLGFAGFRLHAPIKTPKYFDEVIVFLGASYFRAVGKDEVFGLSARGLAVDTASPRGEEFPYFREFWLVTPEPRARQMEVFGLLDGPRVTGAYRFTIEPGERTVVTVRARLFFRDAVEKIGLAPLTSMFFHGENTQREFVDFRPEAHDSDGVLIYHGEGEWLWRPLDNPSTLEVRSHNVMNLRGFGLVQRDRDFRSYEDLEARYDRRPSAWVTPDGDWGAGRVELVQIPTKADTNDNIAVFWVPEREIEAGAQLEFGYTLQWFGDFDLPGGFVVATRRDGGNQEGVHRFVVDFDGRRLQGIPPEEVLRGDVSIAAEEEVAELVDQQVVKNPVTGGWRLTFQIRPKGGQPVELRAFLEKGGEALTETWSYTLVP